jgi:DNA-binding NarL/FixJ family response regulator
MKIRVLVVDDFPLQRDGLTASLEVDPQIQVVGDAHDGESALALARRLRPDVALVDMHMPGLGGPPLVARFQREVPECRVLVLSASERPETLLDAVSAGAAGYLTKRVGGRELRHAVTVVHGGGSMISPSLAGYLLTQYSQVSRGERRPLRPLLDTREQEILRLLVDGRTDREIGGAMFISARTVQNCLTKIRGKTGLTRRAELARWAVEHALA